MSCLVNAFKSIQNIYLSWFSPVEPPKIEEKIMAIHFKDSKYDSDSAYLGRYDGSCRFSYEGKAYPNVEAAFQAAICEDKIHRNTFARLELYREDEYDYKLTYGEKELLKQKAITDRIGYVARFLGNSLPVKKISDLEKRNQILKDIVFSKFTSDPILRQKLLDTKDAQLIEEEIVPFSQRFTFNPTNTYGKVLMDVRKRLVEEKRLVQKEGTLHKRLPKPALRDVKACAASLEAQKRPKSEEEDLLKLLQKIQRASSSQGATERID